MADAVTGCHHEGVSDAQTWTLIAGFLAIMVAMSSLLLRVVRVEIRSVRSDLSAEIRAVRSDLSAEIGSVRSDLSAEIGSVRSDLSAEIGSARSDLSAESGSIRSAIAVLGHKVDGLDRDVQLLFNREFGNGSDTP